MRGTLPGALRFDCARAHNVAPAPIRVNRAVPSERWLLLGVELDGGLTAVGEAGLADLWRGRLRLSGGPGLLDLRRLFLGLIRLGRRELADGRLEQARQVIALDRLHFFDAGDHLFELVAVLGEDLLGGVVGLVDDAADLLVDLLGDLLAVVALLGDLAAEKDHLLLAAEAAR